MVFLTRAGCKNKNLAKKFSCLLKNKTNKANVLKLVGRLFLGENTHIFHNSMDQNFGLNWQQPAIGKLAILFLSRK